MLRHIDDAQLLIPFTCPVKAELAADNICSALGITVRGHSPVLTLCRALVKAGVDPNRPLHAHRDGMLCIVVRTIAEGARLVVKERRQGPVFEKYYPYCPPVSPPIASFERAGVRHPSRSAIAGVAS